MKLLKRRNAKKYETLSKHYNFTPVAVETLGPWGPEAISFVSKMIRRLSTATGDPRSTAFLRQKISLAVQRENAACMTQLLPAGTHM